MKDSISFTTKSHIFQELLHLFGKLVHSDLVRKNGLTKQARTVGFVFQSKESSQELLVRDRDTKYSKEFDEILREYNIEVNKLPFRSPNLNPYAEG